VKSATIHDSDFFQQNVANTKLTKMLEDDTVEEFYSKMSLRKTVSDVKLIREILRSLHECFRIKVTTIEESKQLERVIDEKLTHMLSIQKSPTNKTDLGYVPPPSDILSTSKTVFVKPTVPDPPPTVENKGKDKINGDVLATQKLPTIRRSHICHHCRLNGHVRPQCSLLKAQRAKVKKEVPIQVNYDIRPLAQYQTPRHQASQYQAPRCQAPQHQRPQQRFVPTILVANPRPTNPGPLKSLRRRRMINTARSYLFGCRA
jgi:hypothetical protein